MVDERMTDANMLPLHRTPAQWDHVFLKIAHAMAERSKDPSTQCGAVLVASDNVLLSTGFNGPPPEMSDELVPWDKRPDKYAFIIHAEENALFFGVQSHGLLRMKGSTVYCTHHPCSDCVLRLIRHGVRRVVIPENCPPYPMSKWQVEPWTVIEAQAFPRLYIERV